MGPKKVSAKDSAEKKKKKLIAIELKKEIIDKYESGVRVVDIRWKIASLVNQREATRRGIRLRRQSSARALYGDLLKQNPGTSTEETSVDAFKTNSGWFDNFKKWTGVHSIVWYREAASSDTKAAEDFMREFCQLIAAEGYIAQQVFNCDEAGHFWKKIPRRTYITAEEKKLPGHKPMKDRLTLANASEDLKHKSLFVYHSENTQAFKSHKILKEKPQ
ncbi:tigger transposable element-derived protein 1-like, partial [Octopus bimaculoides]|uniref:tigger transposable element-derived protein 1-like n=1 Tax=Octopus bimaculoides TaxID=37653 RepID=UPI00071D6762